MITADQLEAIGVILVTMAGLAFLVTIIVAILVAVAVLGGLWGKVFVGIFLTITIVGTLLALVWVDLEELATI